MFVFAIAFIAAVATVTRVGGDFRALDRFRFRGGWLLALAATAQVGLAGLSDGPGARALHVASLVTACAVMFANLDVTGMTLAITGGISNLSAIVANFGVMPAWPPAWSRSGAPALADGFANARPIPGASLQILGDWIPVPAVLPASAPISIGDLLLAAGLFVVLHAATDAPWTRRDPANRRTAPPRQGDRHRTSPA